MSQQTLSQRWDWRRLRATALQQARPYLDPDSAEDALLRAWRHARTCDAQDPAAWVATIARREALRTVGRRQPEPVDDIVCRDLSPAGNDDDAQLALERMDIRHSLHGLSPAEQQVLLLRYWADMTHQQIATALGTPLGTIKLRAFRARRKLAGVVHDPPRATGSAKRAGPARPKHPRQPAHSGHAGRIQLPPHP